MAVEDEAVEDEAVEDEVRAVSVAYHTALTGNDASLVATFTTDDWVYVDPAGTTPKAELIGWIAAGRLAHHTMTVVGDERLARVSTDTVLLTARKVSSGTWEGTPYTADEWMTDVFVRTAAGTWLCALSHKTPAAPA
jgi:ketosteroid isomerase-like protein